MSERTIAVVDGNSLIHRAFHALPPSMTAADGRPTNAVFGFVQMLLKAVEVLGPYGVVVAWDAGKPTFRSDVLGQYKMQRPPTDTALRQQFPMVREILDAMAVPQVAVDGWEADDLLGTLAAQAEECGLNVLLITSDRDAYQLVDDRVKVVSTRRGLTDIAVYDREGVHDRLGVWPEQVPDYLGLKGDTSDNIPGVPGVGEKTAAKLIAEYGSLDATLAAAADIKGKLGENLRGHTAAARVSRDVATIRCDAPIDLSLSDVSFGGFDEEALLALFTEYSFTSLMNKVFLAARRAGGGHTGASAAGSAASGAASSAAAQAGGVTPTDGTAPSVWRITSGPEASPTALGWVRNGPGVVVGVALAAEGGETLLPSDDLGVARNGEVVVASGDDVEALLRSLLASARIAAGDTKALLQRLCPPGVCPSGDDILEPADPTSLFDVAIAAYLVDSGRSSYDLDSLYPEYLGHRLPKSQGETAAAADAARAAAELAPVLAARLAEQDSMDCFERIEMPLVPVLARMERVGVGVDTDVLAALAEETGTQAASVVARIQEEAGVEFNVDSPKQLAEVLFEKMDLPSSKRTKTGYSTDASVLTTLAESHPIAGLVLEYRELTKLKSTYIDALPRLIAADGRLHTTFNQTVAATGRLSSSSPNLQNIPVRTELGRRIRAAFVPAASGDVIVSADYSQIELRILAHLSGDPGLIEAFTSGADFHQATAARVFALEPGEIDAEHRRRAKAVNFGIVYGISAHGLAISLGIGRAEAQTMIDRYFEAYPGVREYLDRTVAEAHREGYAVTLYGRRRRIPELGSSNFNLRSFGERTAMNHPMQGTAADIMKLAMIEVDRRLRAEGFASWMVLQVHDELVFETPTGELERLEDMAASVMAGVAELSVPLEVSVSSGANWASAK
jgi:DNA polymerase-1